MFYNMFDCLKFQTYLISSPGRQRWPVHCGRFPIRSSHSRWRCQLWIWMCKGTVWIWIWVGYGYGCAMVRRSCTTFIRNLLTASLTVLWLLYCIYTTCTPANSANQTSNLHKLYWPHLNHIQEGLYGVYADVPFFRTWIDEQIAAKGGATFCS